MMILGQLLGATALIIFAVFLIDEATKPGKPTIVVILDGLLAILLMAVAFVNILENPEIRATLPQIANWPTFPQLWVAGELIGGSDIIYQMFQDGELQPLIEANSPAV